MGRDRYAVMGNPIAHSKSPRIHRLFAEQTGQALTYEAILVAPGEFRQAVERFQKEGGRGLNVTVPFKQEAWALVESRSERAAEAVNTLVLGADGSRFGDNTDGAGLVRDLTVNHGVALGGSRILLLGAGGAVRGVLQPLLDLAPAKITIANRTAEKARVLARRFGTPVRGGGFPELDGPYDVIINGTAASLAGELPPLPDVALAASSICYDMMYAREPTVFMAWAAARGAAQVLDGLGMLVEQAAESFALWRGVRPETAEIIAALRREMVA